MKRKGLLAIEYCVLLAVLIAVFIGMKFFIKRSIMGKWRENADTFGHGRQYEPGITIKRCYDGNQEVPCD